MTAGRSDPRRAPRARLSNRRTLLIALAGSPMLALIGGCSPKFDWREVRAPGGEILVQLPARPASMTRRIHLRHEEIEMTMLGAEVDRLAFTVALARGGPDETAADAARHLVDMRDQMLRNISATPDTTARDTPVDIAVVDETGARRGQRPATFVAAQGTGQHADIRLKGEFFLVRGAAAQAVVIGRDFDDDAARHFFDSLRIVEP